MESDQKPVTVRFTSIEGRAPETAVSAPAMSHVRETAVANDLSDR